MFSVVFYIIPCCTFMSVLNKFPSNIYMLPDILLYSRIFSIGYGFKGIGIFRYIKKGTKMVPFFKYFAKIRLLDRQLVPLEYLQQLLVPPWG